jgi:hypothetical protein
MTRRLVAAAAIAASLGGAALTAVPAQATTHEKPLVCVGGDNQRGPGATGACIYDPTRGLDGGH